MPVERRRVIYRGRVQGVGFRYTAHRLAQDFEVAGFVRNLPDGTVELVVEGEPPEVAALLGAVARAMDRYIEQTTVQTLSPGGEPLVGFSIRF
jgi:acylphosphatase